MYVNSWAQSFNFNEDIMQICQYFAFNSGYVFQSRPIKTKNFRIVDSLRPQSHDDIRLLQGGWLALPFKARFRPTLPPSSKWTFHLMRNSPITSLSISIHRFIRRDEFSLCILPKIIDSVPKLQGIKLAFPGDNFMHILVQNRPRRSLSYKGLPQVYSIPIRSDSNSGKKYPFHFSSLDFLHWFSRARGHSSWRNDLPQTALDELHYRHLFVANLFTASMPKHFLNWLQTLQYVENTTLYQSLPGYLWRTPIWK